MSARQVAVIRSLFLEATSPVVALWGGRLASRLGINYGRDVGTAIWCEYSVSHKEDGSVWRWLRWVPDPT
jgi:hypothetical protein